MAPPNSSKNMVLGWITARTNLLGFASFCSSSGVLEALNDRQTWFMENGYFIKRPE